MSALTALGVNSESYGAMLCSALLRTLPSELVIDYHRRRTAVKEDNGLRIEGLLDFLKTEVESREQALQVGRQERKNPSTKPRFENEKTREWKASTASLYSGSGSRHMDPCAFCAAKNHGTKECQAPLSLEEKKKTLRDSGRCFRLRCQRPHFETVSQQKRKVQELRQKAPDSDVRPWVEEK
ncbi:hypothetical protein HPB48_013272 [Haemaphysalis longicornis]|uniref:Uncharacterized protein n=1 Tax=Haemaphysalis longicornis TaxID=44386 RepID=A0A9J6G9M8_HAELO|nr:hypothetical protein HPB48_013272 [Haemaphysalis longicornis]